MLRISIPTPAASRRHLPLGLLGMLALVGMVERGIVVPHDLQWTERTTHCWQYAGRASRSAEVVRSDVIALGDSQIKLGVVPTLIAARTGRPGFNLAVPGGQVPSSYFLLRRAIEAGARPRGVVLGLFPGLLAIDQRMNLAAWPELLEVREALDLALTARDADLFVRIVLARVLPSVHKRDVIGKRWTLALRGEPNEEYPNVLAHLRNWRVNRGGQVTPAPNSFRDAVDEATRQVGPSRLWKPNPTNAAYLDRLLALAARHEIRVFWVLPTISPAWQAHREVTGLDAVYERYARALVERHPNLVVVDGRRSGYDVTAFRDQFHLESRGATTLSFDLGAILNDSLDAPPAARWVRLPHYGERPVGRAPEDVDQSRRLVVAGGGRRLR